MRNPFADYKTLLDTFSYEEQINELAHEKHHANKIDRRYEQIKELKHMKNIINKSYQWTNLYIYIYGQYHENNKPQICK